LVRIGLPAFFSLPTIVAALISIGTGLFYGFCWFKGEKGEEIKPVDKEANNKKSGLASKGAAPGCASAARGGHLEVVQWAHANGCPWDEQTCARAAGGGRLAVLQWARANGCPWD